MMKVGFPGKPVCIPCMPWRWHVMAILLWVLLALPGAPLLFGGGIHDGSRPGGASEEGIPLSDTSLRVGILPDLDSVPLVMARELGFFHAQGVSVELVAFKNPVNRDGALQTGAIDGAVSDLLAAAFAAEGGFSLRAVAKTDGSYKLLGSAPGGIDTLEKLGAGEVALSRNTIIEYCTDRILSAGGYGRDFIEKVSIPQIPVRLEMLKSGSLDGATLPEPLASLAVAEGAHILGSSDDLGINPGVLLFSEAALQNKHDALVRFVSAYNRTVAWIASRKGATAQEELRKRVVDVAGFPPSAREVLQLPEYTMAELPLEREVQQVMEWLQTHGLVQGEYRYQDLVDPSILKTVQELNGTLRGSPPSSE